MGYRYIGSKTRIIDWVLSTVSETCAPGDHVVDLMTGTASVASALRAAGYRVTANDVMTYSYHHARAVLLLSEPPSFSGINGMLSESTNPLSAESPYERALQAITSLDPVEGYFWRELSPGGKPDVGGEVVVLGKHRVAQVSDRRDGTRQIDCFDGYARMLVHCGSPLLGDRRHPETSA